MTEEDLAKILQKIDNVASVATALSKRMDAFEKSGRAKQKKADSGDFGPPPALRPTGLPQPPVARPGPPVATDYTTYTDDDGEPDVISELHEIETLESELRRRKTGVAQAMKEAGTPTPEEGFEMAEIQSRADSVFNAFALRAPPPRPGENALRYRKRLMNSLKQYSPECEKMNLSGVVDPTAIEVFEKQIYTDAVKAADQGAGVPPGRERRIAKRLDNGQLEYRFVRSDGGTFIKEMNTPPLLARFIDPRVAALQRAIAEAGY